MSRRVLVYITLVGVAASIGLVAWLINEPPVGQWPWLGGLLMLALCCLLESRSARMRGGNAVSIATIPHLAGVFLLPAPMAVAAAALGMWFDLLRLRQPRSRIAFNISNIALTVAVAALTAKLLGARGSGFIDGGLDDVARFLVVVVVYYLVNSLVLSGIISLATNEPLISVFWSSARASAPAEVAVSVIGGLAVYIWLTNAAWLVVVVFPMLIAQLTLDYLAASDLKTRELERQAFHDALTGLPNRTALQRDLDRLLVPYGSSVGLLLIDLDGFKDVNDTFGHHQGDALLREVAIRFTEVVGGRGTIARLGGDEFAVLLSDCTIENAQALASELLSALGSPVCAGELELFVGASIGLACSPDHGSEPEVLLRRADVAMYAAKAERCGVAIYHPDRDAHDRDRVELLHDLRLALSHGQLWLAYQPKVSARLGRLESVEALVRWNHPTRGAVSPALFVPLAEQAGLSDVLARWVLTAALAQCRAWQDLGYSIPVWVNVSMYELRDESFPSLVAEQLTSFGMHPDLLGIEMTESAAMADPARTCAVLGQLRALGVHVAVDDFGTGYSSLAYLAGLPVDELKIDRSFIVGMRSSAQHAAIVRATINLGHDLGLVVVAEGAEDDLALQRLREQGCDLIQGYAICRPLAAPELLRWFQARAQELSQAA